jgi:uncharacterized protein with ATP-grasp and redox domains
MRVEHDCIDCLRNQIQKTATLLVNDPVKIKEIIVGVNRILDEIPPHNSPPEVSEIVYQYLHEITGVADPYLQAKEKSNQVMIEQYGHYKNIVDSAPDPLEQALLLAGLGNMIDYGANPNLDLDIDQISTDNLHAAIFDYDDFKHHYSDAENILFLADNAGETVLDRILIETLDRPVTYAVKSAPIINDALIEDARAVGIDRIARVIESGCRTPGTVLRRCSLPFQELFMSADMIISKGQGNFEGLSEEVRPIFFILKVKCELISRHIQAPIGSLVLKGINTQAVA